MITATQIRNGNSYMRVHLSQNDYYSESESIVGEWWGEGAKRLGLDGFKVSEKHFQSLRDNRHPFSGGKLTPRSREVAFHDVVLSAPKSYSVMAKVGGDQRLVEAFEQASRKTFLELEKFAAVRVRHGKYAKTEAYRFTGNGVAAVYHHDSSRLLGPQLHTHLVFGNVSYCEEGNRWLALQRRPMMEASKASVREFFHRELAGSASELGYEVEWTEKGMRLKGVRLELERKFSERSIQREGFEARYRKLFGKDPAKSRVESFIKDGKKLAAERFRGEYREAFGRSASGGEIEAFVKDWRSSKMASSSREDVLMSQQAKLTSSEKRELRQLLEEARKLSSGIVDSEMQGQQVQIRESTEEVRAGETRQEIIAPVRVDLASRSSQASPVQSEKRTANQRISAGLASQRMEVMRRYRRGLALNSALRGYPGVFFASQITRLARQRR